MMSVGWISTLVAILVLGSIAQAEHPWDAGHPTDPVAQARAAFAFSEVASQKTAFLPTYGELRNQAVRDDRPLCVWIGYGCPSSARQVNMLHFQAGTDTWDGKWHGPGVLIGVPHDGDLYVGEFVRAEDCCAAELDRAAQRSRERFAGAPVVVRRQSQRQESDTSRSWSSKPTATGTTVKHPAGRGGAICVG